MNIFRRTLVLAGFAAIASTNAMAQSCPGGTANVITEPAAFQWDFHPASANNPEPYYSGTMEVGEATFNINGDTLTTRAYGQAGVGLSIPGPSLNMDPGSKYVLSFHNTLPYEAPEAAHNVFKDANISNIHTHGLHISGETPGDDVTRYFEGGFGGDFVYDIPADHMGGSYWYHAHHHGSTMLQVAGGAFGMIVIDDANDGIPQNVQDMTERVVEIVHLQPSVAGTSGDTLMSGTMPDSWTVNGQVDGTMCQPAGEWQHWRVLLADKDASPETVTVGAGCEVQLLARDGVFRTEAPLALGSNSVTMPAASRADLAVRCSGNSTLSVGNTQVASIVVNGSADTGPHPFAASGSGVWSAARPAYLRDLMGETDVNNESVKMGARTVNGQKFDANQATFTLPADKVQDWSISAAGRHPFHLHVYHMQADGCGGDYEDGEFYDVIASSCNVRFDLNPATSTPYRGRTIMHCHILEHEDQGAMGWLDVIGGQAPPTFPADGDVPAYGDYYATTAPPTTVPNDPTSLAAAGVSSSTIDLSWTDNATDEDGFDIERFNGSTWDLVDTVPTNATSYTDTGLSASTSYDYRVSAYNGAGYSGVSNTATGTTLDPDFIPNAPSGLLATATSTSTIDLAWTDNSANENGFDIERSVSGGGFSFLATVGADVTSYTDSGLAASTTYDYQVASFNDAGSSAFSNVSGDTTQDVVGATSVTVGSITVSTYGAGQGKKGGRAVVIVNDDQGQPVADATVTGDFTGTFSETVSSGATNGSGSTTLDTSGAGKGNVSVTFCVTGISHATLNDFSAAPGTVCSSL